MIDRIIFGDNQFFGINHMSEVKAQELAEKFNDMQSIFDVYDIAYDCGIRAFMLNSNDRAKYICDYFRENINKYAGMTLYPSIPYPRKYASLIAERGLFPTLKEAILSDNTAKDIFNIVSKGGASLFEKDMIKVMQILVDIEMKIFNGLPYKVIFLQNIVTDLLLGLQVKEVFVAFDEYIKHKYNAKAGFISMNLPKLSELLLNCGISEPIICSSINKSGYFMNPDISTYETTIKEENIIPVAMSIFASGAIRPSEGVEYICAQKAIKSIVFGSSRREHISQTIELIERSS